MQISHTKSRAKSIPNSVPPSCKCFFSHLFKCRVTGVQGYWTLLVWIRLIRFSFSSVSSETLSGTLALRWQWSAFEHVTSWLTWGSILGPSSWDGDSVQPSRSSLRSQPAFLELSWGWGRVNIVSGVGIFWMSSVFTLYHLPQRWYKGTEWPRRGLVSPSHVCAVAPYWRVSVASRGLQQGAKLCDAPSLTAYLPCSLLGQPWGHCWWSLQRWSPEIPSAMHHSCSRQNSLWFTCISLLWTH